jgi:alpha-2-macroglobulin
MSPQTDDIDCYSVPTSQSKWEALSKSLWFIWRVDAVVGVTMVSRRWFRVVISWVCGLLLILGLHGCNQLNPSARQPFPEVADLPNPTLPTWIEQISPLDNAEPLAQIRVRFKDPLIPLEALESQGQQELLSKFQLTPALPGQFRFLTPKMVGFVGTQAIPQATRVQVTLKAGLKDLKQHQLAQDLAWTFETAAIKLTELPGTALGVTEESDALELLPELTFTANTELDTNSLREHLKLTRPGSEDSMGLKVLKSEENTTSETGDSTLTATQRFDPSQRLWNYTVTPLDDLDKDQGYQLEFTPGLRPAQGNLATTRKLVRQFRTYAPLAFNKLDYVGAPDSGGTSGRFNQGRAELRFNNPLVAESASKEITITPKPKPAPTLIRAYDDSRTVDLNPWSLEPNTQYTIKIGADLKDKYGQTLGEPQEITYETGDLAADFWAPSGLNIFPAGQELQLNLTAVNLPDPNYQAAFRVVRPQDLVYTDNANPQNEGNDLLPGKAQWQRLKIDKPQPNQTSTIAIPLRQQLGGPTGMLAYGVQARTNAFNETGQQQWREPDFYGLVQLTNLGVFSQWLPNGGWVRVHQLSDGATVNGAEVSIYPSRLDDKSRASVSPCATGRTKANGMAEFSRDQILGCLPSDNRNLAEAPQLLVVASQGQDWAFTRNLGYSGAYGFGVDAGWNGGKPESRGIIFSDRQLYQPGETGWFTGVAYYLQNGDLIQDKNAGYQVKLKGPNDETTDLGRQTTNEFGTFSLQVPLGKTLPLGFYTIEAKGSNDKTISGNFRLAEFKPPNFKVDLKLDRQFAQGKDPVQVNAQSNYLFGPAVAGAEAKFYVTRRPAEFSPKGWNGFSFGRQWLWPEERPEVPTDVLETRQTLDASGKGNTSFLIPEDLPYPMDYRVDVEVADASNLSVADSKTITALPSSRLIGVKSEFVGAAGKPLPVQLIVTDPEGKAVGGENITVELQKIKYSSATQVIEGSRTPRNQVEYQTVDTTGARSDTKPVTVNLNPKESGTYRIRVNLAGARDEVTATETQIWVSGNEPVFWGNRYRNERLDVKLDKETYKPGETATVLLESPYPEADLHLAVVRNRVLYQTVQTVKGSTPKLQFTVTADMLPNAAVEAVLVRRGAPLTQKNTPTDLDSLSRVGFAPFKIDHQNLALQVAVDPVNGRPNQTELLEPQGKQTVRLQLQDQQKRPVSGQLSVMVVNEAILQLTGYRVPDLVETVYAEQPISLRFADNRADVVLQPLYSPLDKGWGFGGGASAGAGGTRVRTDFRPLAFYNGAVRTDAQGRAEVSFQMPDDLTTWRVMVVGIDLQNRFGRGDATFVTSKPLVTNPVLPQFARPGDRFEAGLSVSNNTGQTGNVNIVGTTPVDTASSPPGREPTSVLRFADQPQVKLETKAEASQTQAHRFPILAGKPGTSQLQFQSSLGSATDAFAVPLEVKANTNIEQVVTAGTTRNQVDIPLNIDAQMDKKEGGLHLSLASSLIPQLQLPAAKVLDPDQLPLLEPAASQLLLAANLQDLGTTSNQTFSEFNPKQRARDAFVALQKLQRPDGGFGAWPQAKESDPWLTPYAAQAIARGRQVYPDLVPAGLQLDKLQTYLQGYLANPSQGKVCANQSSNQTPNQPLCRSQLRLEMLLGLDALGDRRADFLGDIVNQRSQLDRIAQIRLATYLSQFPQWQAEAAAQFRQIQQTIYQTGRASTVNLPESWRWLDQPAVYQAEALRLYIAQKADSADLDRLLQALLDLRRQGIWSGTYANAQAVSALVAYSQLEPAPPNFTAKANLANQTIAEQRFQGNQKLETKVDVPMARLARGQQTLKLSKSGTGLLHYLTTLRYQPTGVPAGRLNGLRVTRYLRPANQAEVLSTFGIAAATEPITVEAGQVFDVGVEVIADHPVNHVVIDDLLPAGFEAVDTQFQTSTAYFQPLQDNWEIDYQTIHRDRISSYADSLAPGVYNLHYLVRAITPGTYIWPGAEAHLQYAPEEFGRTTAAKLVVK